VLPNQDLKLSKKEFFNNRAFCYPCFLSLASNFLLHFSLFTSHRHLERSRETLLTIHYHHLERSRETLLTSPLSLSSRAQSRNTSHFSLLTSHRHLERSRETLFTSHFSPLTIHLCYSCFLSLASNLLLHFSPLTVISISLC